MPVRAVLGLLVAGGLVFGVWQVSQRFNQADAAQTPYQTTAVRRGDLTLTASGTGTLIAGNTAELNFPVDGVVGTLNVQVGDEVKSGQVLAVLEDIEELEVDLQFQQLALDAAQKDLDDLLNDGDAQLALALSELADAQSVHAEAIKNHHKKGDSRCNPSLTQEYYFEYLYAQQRVDEWEDYLYSGTTGYGTNYILTRLAPMRKDRDNAYANLKYCESYTEHEILRSDANLQVAEANLNKAEERYGYLLANAGVDLKEVEITRAKEKNYELQLARAENDLAKARLVAPMDGTIISISAGEGDSIDSDTVFITIADLNKPLVQVSVDEADLQSFSVGCSAQTTFNAIENRVFDGVVTQVSPTLVTYSFGGMSVVQGLVELQDAALMPGQSLRLNLNGTVNITCNQAGGALLVPVSAINGDGTGNAFYVYVLDDDGNPEKRPVEIGSRSVRFAEILSGLRENERVVTDAAVLN